MEKPDLICVAAIAGAFGVKGEVKVKAFTEEAKTCMSFGPLTDVSGKIIFTPVSSRAIKDGLAVIAAEVKTREEAEALKSTKLFADRALFPETEEDEFYFSDLIGLDVKTIDGKRMGKVIALHDYGAGEMLEIKPKDSASFYHPFTKLAVPKVDLAAGRVIIKIEEPQ